MTNMTRFILKPRFNNLSEQWLQYQDLLTYLTIRSYYNTEDKYCYPSYETLHKRCGLSKKFLSRSIKRLEKAGLIKVWKVGTGRVQHYYEFPDSDILIKVPYNLLEVQDITCNQLAMLLVVHENCDSLLECSLSSIELAEKCGLSQSTVSNLLNSIFVKGYLDKMLYKDPIDNTLTKKLRLTDKVKWLPLPNSEKAEEIAKTSDKPTADDLINMLRRMGIISNRPVKSMEVKTSYS